MIFPELVSLYKKKFSLLNGLFARQVEARYKLDADDVDSVINILSYDNNVIDEIDGIDFSISRVKDQLKATMGMADDTFEKTITESKDPLISEIKELRGTIEVKAAEIAKERDELMKLLQDKAKSISKDIGDLARMKNLEFTK
ncbi:MAG: hypothetical protein GY754_43975 [bacterium]|nr:hypothetical protein [bacterium]